MSVAGELLWLAIAATACVVLALFGSFTAGLASRAVVGAWRFGRSVALALEPSSDHVVVLRMVLDERFVRQLHAEAAADDPETPELESFRALLVAGLLAAELGFLSGARRRHLAGALLEVVSGG